MADSASTPQSIEPIQRVFILRSRIGRNIYLIRGDALEVTWRLWGAHQEARIPLKSISADYEVRAVRHLRQVLLLLIPVALCVVAYRFLLSHPEWPDFLFQIPLYIGATFAVAAIKLYPRFEWFVFKNHFGRPLFTILREPEQREECEAFLHALLDRIEGTDSPSAHSIEPAKAAGSGATAKWKMAIVFMLFSLVVPPLWFLYGERSDAVIFVPGLLGSGGAIIMAIVSYVEKEPRRRWAIAAAVAALIPIWLYRDLVPLPPI